MLKAMNRELRQAEDRADRANANCEKRPFSKLVRRRAIAAEKYVDLCKAAITAQFRKEQG